MYGPGRLLARGLSRGGGDDLLGENVRLLLRLLLEAHEEVLVGEGAVRLRRDVGRESTLEIKDHVVGTDVGHGHEMMERGLVQQGDHAVVGHAQVLVCPIDELTMIFVTIGPDRPGEDRRAHVGEPRSPSRKGERDDGGRSDGQDEVLTHLVIDDLLLEPCRDRAGLVHDALDVRLIQREER